MENQFKVIITRIKKFDLNLLKMFYNINLRAWLT